jgi:hypothetical protein
MSILGENELGGVKGEKNDLLRRFEIVPSAPMHDYQSNHKRPGNISFLPHIWILSAAPIALYLAAVIESNSVIRSDDVKGSIL